LKKTQTEHKTEIIKRLHMIVQADFIVNLARQGFWFEDREYWAKELLSSFQGIKEDQIDAVLNGNATVTGWSICEDKTCEQCKGLTQSHYEEIEDTKFKEEIKHRVEYLKDNFYKVGEIHVSKNVINEYLIQKELVRILQKFGDVSRGEEDIILGFKYESIFQDAINERIKVEDIPEAGTKKHRFAIALQKFLSERYEKEKDNLWHLANKDLKKKLVVYTGADQRILNMIDMEDEKHEGIVDAFTGKKKEINPNIEADGDPDWPCEIEYNGDIIKLGNYKIEKRFLDDYANEVRFTRSMMIFANSQVMQHEALQHPIQKREAKHRQLYTLLGLPYHGEEQGQPDDIIDQVWELSKLIDQYVIEKYPEVDINNMAKELDSKLDFIEKFKNRNKKDVSLD